MSWLTEVPLAHRGLHDHEGGTPENTLAAFTRARDAGVGVELDVWLSRDDRVVVAHDPDLTRVAGRSERIGELTAAELAEVSLYGGGHGVPALADVLDELAGTVPVMVEVKNPRPTVGPLESAVARIVDPYRDGVAVASFNPRTVAWFRDHAPAIQRGQTSGSFRGPSPLPVGLRGLLRSLATNRWTQPHYVSYELDGLPHPAVDACRRRGLPVITWTVRTVEQLQRAQSLADNVIFEHLDPDLVRHP